MREAMGPPIELPPLSSHLLEPIVHRAGFEPRRPVASYRAGDRYLDLTAREFYARVRDLAKGLIAVGVEPGDRVALMSHTRLEWLVVDYAILAVGGVTVPVYETSSAEQLRWILTDSESVAAVLETSEMAAMFGSFAHETRCWASSFVIERGGLDELVLLGGTVEDTSLDERIAALKATDLATIVYTSGTTGRPKGCELTHGNLRTNAQQILDAGRLSLRPDDVNLLFLPLAHTLTKIIALTAAESGSKLAFATDVAHLEAEMAMVRPTLMVAVPRVFEKIFDRAQHKAHATRRGWIFRKSVEIAIRWSEGRAAGRTDTMTRVNHFVLDYAVYRRIRAVFGGRLRAAFSGGGPLGERLTNFFSGTGLSIFEGYGLTETSPTLTVNRADAWKPGTVGPPVAGTAIRIADDGEVLAKGPQVFRGYWRNNDATAAAFDDAGWFLTGDLGELDDDGFLRITGRKKDIIVTAAGKNVAPAPLEERLRAHPLISQAVVVGEGRPFIAALITLDGDATRHRAESDVSAAIEAAVDDANQSVSRAESIRAFALLPDDLTVESGELTPTLKVRRAVVATRRASVIEGLYRSHGSANGGAPVAAIASN